MADALTFWVASTAWPSPDINKDSISKNREFQSIQKFLNYLQRFHFTIQSLIWIWWFQSWNTQCWTAHWSFILTRVKRFPWNLLSSKNSISPDFIGSHGTLHLSTCRCQKPGGEDPEETSTWSWGDTDASTECAKKSSIIFEDSWDHVCPVEFIRREPIGKFLFQKLQLYRQALLHFGNLKRELKKNLSLKAYITFFLWMHLKGVEEDAHRGHW